MDILLINFIVYLVTLLVIIFKQKDLTVYVLVWTAYTINALCGYLCVIFDVHYSKDPSLGEHLSPIPYFILYLLYHLIASPFKNLKVSDIDTKCLALPKFKTFIHISFAVYIIVSIVRIFEVVLIFSIGFGEVYETGMETGVRVMVFDNPLLVLISNLGNTYSTVTMPILAFYFFHRLVSKDNIIVNLMSLIIIFTPSIASGICLASKGGLFFLGMNILFIFVFFKNSLEKKVRRIIYCGGAVAISLFLFLSSLITDSRNTYSSSKEETWETSVRYMGESVPNLGYFYYDNPINHPYGSRFFPYFSDKKILSPADRNDYWESFAKVPIAYTKTILGDCILEYGLVGGILFIILTVYFLKRIAFKNYNKFYKFIFISNYFQCMAITSIWVFGYPDPLSMILMLFIFSLYIKHITYRR